MYKERMFPRETWREYIFKFKINYPFRLEISNYGRVKSFNKNAPEGRILKGTLQEGYPIIRLTFPNPVAPKDQVKLVEFDSKIKAFSILIKALKSQLKVGDASLEEEILQKTLIQKDLVNKRKKANRKYKLKTVKYCGLLIHRAVAELFLELPVNKEKFVIHLDYDKENNFAENLKWATQKEVTSHQMSNPKIAIKKREEKFSGKSTSFHHNSKLSENEVILIKRKLKKEGMTLRKLGKQFGVSDMQIHRIKTGENWSSVKEIAELQREQQS